jgi:outer membrane protein assembly factor BamA
MLGGQQRFRGFEDNRFHDRAAIYASAELRLVPTWNPFKKISILKDADITWMQWAIFAEAGRVSNEYSPDLLSHLKGDVGFGLRILAKDTLVRFDIAASSEGYQLWVGLSEPF